MATGDYKLTLYGARLTQKAARWYKTRSQHWNMVTGRRSTDWVNRFTRVFNHTALTYHSAGHSRQNTSMRG